MAGQELSLDKWWEGHWHGDTFDPKQRFNSLASQHRDGQSCLRGQIFNGSFHVCVRVVFEDKVDWMIRLPLPERLLQRNMHTRREVAILLYLSENTKIPIPHIVAYNYDDVSNSDLGPYIISAFAAGIPLTEWFKDSYFEGTRLSTQIDDKTTRTVYRQAANVLLEFTSTAFPSIGTLSIDEGKHRAWSIVSSPWTLTLHEAERHHNVHPQPTHGPFRSSRAWISYLSDHHEQIIREDTKNPRHDDDLQSLREFRDMIPHYISADSFDPQFKLHCDDFTAGNMLVGKDYEIVGVGDWEFTYTAPVEYQACLASWLILSKPHEWSHEDYDLYSTRLKLFLEVLEEEENQRAIRAPLQRPRLSEVIRRGWEDGTFWFVLCARSGLYFNHLWDRFRRFDPLNYHQQIFETRKRLLGPGHSETLRSKVILAATQRRCGRATHLRGGAMGMTLGVQSDRDEHGWVPCSISDRSWTLSGISHCQRALDVFLRGFDLLSQR